MLESLFCLLVLFRSEVNVSTLQRVSTGVETKKMCVNFNRQFMEYYHKCANKRVHSKPLCILFSDTKGIQWADTDATNCTMESNPHDGMDVKYVQRSGLNIATMLALAARTDAVVSAYMKP